MAITLIADTGCDLTDALKNLMKVRLVPFKILVGESHFVDDENLDTRALLAEMKRCKAATGTACPSPEEFAAEMRAGDECIVITISSKLSGSYNSALVAKNMVLEEIPDKKIAIIDSESAVSGETRLALLAHELSQAGLSFEETVAQLEDLAKNRMHTFFVLESLDNLIKNGRISKAAGVLGSMLSLRPVMSDDGNGEIACKEKVRGTANAMKRLVEIICETTQDAAKGSVQMVISQCNCADRALALKKELLTRCAAVKDVLIVPTYGLGTVYAYDGGIVVAF